MWKVYNIATGKIVKGGFESDDQAKDWLERRKDLSDDEYDVDEMDEEEEEEYLESVGDEDAPSRFDADHEDDEDDREISYPDEPLRGGKDSDQDDDEDEEDDEEDEDDDDDDEDYE